MTNFLEQIAPPSLKKESNYLQIGEKFSRTLFVFEYPAYLNAGWLEPVVNLDTSSDISLFIYPEESSVILKNLQKQTARVQSQISTEAEKGKVRDPQLEAAIKNMEDLRDKLQTGIERMFKLGLYITVYANSIEELDKKCDRIKQVFESRLVYIKPAIFQMDIGFKTTAPLLQDKLLIHNSLNTEPLSSTFPFISSDLSSDTGILYGVNRHNNSLILFDRFSLENANFTIFATSGAGKSYLCKLEILRSLMLGTDVIIIDPENEYQYLTETAGGAFVKISLSSAHHINPFDLPEPKENEKSEDIFRNNIVSLIGLLRLMLGEKTTEGPKLTPEQDAIIDSALIQTYALKDIIPQESWQNKEMPTMSDFQTILNNIDGAEELGLRLKKYTEGTFSGFLNQPTNISTKNKLIVFNIRDMEEELRPIAMYLILHYIWNLVRSELKKRLLIVDEAWWMMKYPDGASFMFGIVKRARKYYLGVTTITQDITDFVSSPYGKPIITNSALRLLMKQSPAAIDELQKTFYLTDEEKYLLLEGNVGEGIFFAGPKHAAIRVVASYAEDQVITSDPAQLLEIEKAKQELAQEQENE
ncbi:MAG: DUF87 domain-containing protein [bacterium]